MMSKLKAAVLAAGVIALVGVDLWIVRRAPVDAYAPREMTTLPVFTTDSLARYDGTDPTKPVYLAMDGWVYDVSPGREEFYQPGKPYHDLVGKDSTAMLRVAGGEIIKRKYAVVGQYRAE